MIPTVIFRLPAKVTLLFGLCYLSGLRIAVIADRTLFLPIYLPGYPVMSTWLFFLFVLYGKRCNRLKIADETPYVKAMRT
jgi:hypothetical protein